MKCAGRKCVGWLAVFGVFVLVVATERDVRHIQLNHALITAVQRDDTRSAIELLRAGADANATVEDSPRDTQPWNVIARLFHPNAYRRKPLTPILMMFQVAQRPGGGDIRVITTDSEPAHDENLRMLRALLAHHADVDRVDKHGMTALMWAARWKYGDSVQMLLDYGADPNIRNQNGNTALGLASAYLIMFDHHPTTGPYASAAAIRRSKRLGVQSPRPTP